MTSLAWEEAMSHPFFKDKMECIILCAPRDQSHISQQMKEKYHHIIFYITIINT
jgi:hypothetical protein